MPRRRTRISVVWIIPILAAVVAIGIAVQRILSEGPTITIVFKAAEGVEAGKTFVKYKDVNIGQVTAVQLSADYSKVEVTAKIAKSAAGLMVEDAKFWVVEPRVTLSGVSGLGTLLSGNYIGFEVGKSTKKQRTFIGLEAPPIITGGQPGRQFVLKADNLGSLGVGSPGLLPPPPGRPGHRVRPGQRRQGDRRQDLRQRALRPVRHPRNPLLERERDRRLGRRGRRGGAHGVSRRADRGRPRVRYAALRPHGRACRRERGLHPLQGPGHRDEAAGCHRERYVLYFSETLRGLSVGAPVTILGLPAGEVTDVGLDIDPATTSIRGRVEIVAFPERIVARLRAKQAAAGEAIVRSEQQRQAFFQRMVEQRGMRAQLRSGSLLTGQLFVAFDFFPDAPKAKIDWSQDRRCCRWSRAPSRTSRRSSPASSRNSTSCHTSHRRRPEEGPGRAEQALKDAGKAVNRIDTNVTPELKTRSRRRSAALATADRMLKTRTP